MVTVVGSRGRPLTPQVAAARAARASGLKRCTACKADKPPEEFPRNRSKSDGLSTECRACNAARCRARHAANPESYRTRACRWQREHPEEVRKRSRVAASRRRALIRDAFVEDIDPQVVFERDEGVCGICWLPVDRDEFDVDHVIPLAEGGEHSYANVRLAHVPCNRRRGRALALADQRKEV